MKTIKELVYESGLDGEIEDNIDISNYLNLVTANIRENNRKLSRNSFWLILAIIIYLLIKTNSNVISEIEILFTTIKDNVVLLNFIPVFFAFIYFYNVSLWNNNMNLWFKFQNLSKKLFKLNDKTDSSYVIRPFSIIQNLFYYQLSNPNIKSVIKIPTTLIVIIYALTPLLFELYSIYEISVNNTANIISITCIVLLVILTYTTIVAIFIPYRKD